MTTPEPPAGNILNKKIGPLPVIAYVVIIAGVIVAIEWYRHRSSTVSVTPVPTGTDASAVPSLPTDSGSGTGVVTTANGSPSPQTNADWSRMAAAALIAKGLPVTAVENALNNFVNGHTLDPQQEAIVQQALVSQGQPPQGVLPIITNPAPTGSTAPVPHRYTWLPTDSLTSVSEHFFGDPNQGWRIVAANPGVAIHRGAVVTIPIPLSANQYAIMPGDSWESVSMRFYGNKNHVAALKAANPNVRFQRGQTLRIP